MAAAATGSKNLSSSSSSAPRRRGRKGGGTPLLPVSSGAGGSADADSGYRPHKVPLIQLTDDTPTWHECGRNTPGRDGTLSSTGPQRRRGGSGQGRNCSDPELARRYRALGEKIYRHEVALARQRRRAGEAGSDDAWVEGTMRKGTLKDRVAAMSVVVASQPVHGLHALDMLLGMVGINVDADGRTSQSAGRPNDRVANMAAEALTDLWVGTLLPTHRKLVGLEGRPLHQYQPGGDQRRDSGSDGGDDSGSARTLSPRILLLWRYEEHLRHRYAAFLNLYLRRALSESSLDLGKIIALKTAANLLNDVPEGESDLLSMIVNKIGDPARKVASAAGHQLRVVLEVHPNMIHVVASEVQQLAHRPNLSSRALYNCIVFLNQLKLTREEDDGNSGDGDSTNVTTTQRKKAPSLAASLVNTYFLLFEVAMKKSDASSKGRGKAKGKSGGGGGVLKDDGTLRGRLLSALLTGVNRAHPYLPRGNSDLEKHIDALYRIAHTSPPAACTQAFMLLYNLAIGTPGPEASGEAEGGEKLQGSKEEVSRRDRFYRALYSKLSDPAMLSGRQLTLFFNLVYKATKNDVDGSRVAAFTKRLLHNAFHAGPPVIAASIFLTSEVMKYQPALAQSVDTCLPGTFDTTKREPKAAFVSGGEEIDNARCSLWEVALTVSHYHPTVQKFSSSLGEISYAGDPLRDFALAPFLDKLAYRNPKSREHLAKHLKRGESVAERRSAVESSFGTRSALPMNDPSLLDGSRTVTVEDEFFHRFFAERSRRDKAKGFIRGNGDDADTEDDAGELEALDAEEIQNMEQKLDEGWDTDESEQEFAQSIAEKLIESAGNGRSNFDEEDPDMDDWSDVDESVDGKNEDQDQEVDYSAMDDIGIDSSSDEEAIDNDDDGSLVNDSFMDAVNSDYDGDSNGDDQGDSYSDDSDGQDVAMFAASDSDSSESKVMRKPSGGKEKKSKEKRDFSESFVDASEYQDMIEKGWKELKNQPKSERLERTSNESDKQSGTSDTNGRKKRKKRRSRS